MFVDFEDHITTIVVLEYTPPTAYTTLCEDNIYTSLTNFSTKYLVMCKVYTDVGGIKYLYHVCVPVRKIIHSLKIVYYPHVQADNQWYNYDIAGKNTEKSAHKTHARSPKLCLKFLTRL